MSNASTYCPVGGIKVTGYVTPAAQYCAITGGEYTITAKVGKRAGLFLQKWHKV
jgi:hypothetical protein